MIWISFILHVGGYGSGGSGGYGSGGNGGYGSGGGSGYSSYRR